MKSGKNSLISKLGRIWTTFFILIAVASIVGAFGGRVLLHQIHGSLVQTLLEENIHQINRIENDFASRYRDNDYERIISEFQNQFTHQTVTSEGFLCILGDDGRIIAHPESQMIGKPMPPSRGMLPSIVELLRSELQATSYNDLTVRILRSEDPGAAPHLVIQKPILESKMLLSMHINMQSLQERMDQISSQFIRAGIPILLLFVLAGTTSIRSVNRLHELKMERINHELEATVSERTRELRETLNDLEQAKDEAQSADRLKTQLLGVMNHEYRTPLNAILGFGSLLKDTNLTSEQSEFVAEIQNGGNHLLKLIERILLFTSLESGITHPRIRQISIKEWREGLLSQTVEKWRSRGLDIYVENRVEDDNIQLSLETRWLSIVFDELLENAQKFSENPTPFAVIEINHDSEQGTINLFISDNGPGFAKNILSAGFQPFTMGDFADTRSHGGVGMGMAMTKRIVDHLNSKISLSNRNPSRGACIHIQFPEATPVNASNEVPAQSHSF